jgi:hypothetical protein
VYPRGRLVSRWPRRVALRVRWFAAPRALGTAITDRRRPVASSRSASIARPGSPAPAGTGLARGEARDSPFARRIAVPAPAAAFSGWRAP